MAGDGWRVAGGHLGKSYSREQRAYVNLVPRVSHPGSLTWNFKLQLYQINTNHLRNILADGLNHPYACGTYSTHSIFSVHIIFGSFRVIDTWISRKLYYVFIIARIKQSPHVYCLELNLCHFELSSVELSFRALAIFRRELFLKSTVVWNCLKRRKKIVFLGKSCW